MAGHTKGPWRIEGTRGPQFIISAGTNAEGDGPADYVGVLGPMFAAPKRDDALLACAAPDLMEALEWLLASVETDPEAEAHPGDWDERLLLACGAAHTALRKARGEA